MKPRKSDLEITYKDKKITRDLLAYLQSFTYEDSADGESDTISIVLGDRERKWIGGWMPEKKDKIRVSIFTKNWAKEGDKRKLSCGEFNIDTIDVSGEPVALTIGALSGPVFQGFRETARHKTWKKTTLQQIAQKVASRYKLKLHYDAMRIPIKEVEQSDSDSAFLVSTCEAYGLTVKAYKSKIVIYDRERYKKKKAVRVIDRKVDAIDNWSYTDTLTRYYTGAVIEYTNPGSNKEIKKTVGKKTVLLRVDDSADSAADAELKAKAAVNKENHAKTTMSLTMAGDTRFTAGQCVTVKNFGSKISGKYYIDKIAHSIDGDGGYTMQLELAKVGTSI